MCVADIAETVDSIVFSAFIQQKHYKIHGFRNIRNTYTAENIIEYTVSAIFAILGRDLGLFNIARPSLSQML